MSTYVGLVLAGAIGAPLRYVVDAGLQRRRGSVFPLGTLTVNVTGSLVLGVVAGLALTVLPGPGVIMILLGLTLTSFPGKRRAELWIARQSPVHRAINWIRAHAGRPPLLLPESD